MCLALETSGRATGVALVDIAGERVRYERVLAAPPPGAARPVIPLALEALAACGLGLDDVGLLACTHGPGSFTGVRSGLATLMGLGFARGLDVVGVSTLQALAAGAAARAGVGAADALVAPVIDARKGEVYGGLRRLGADGRAAEALLPDGAFRVEDLAARLRALAAGGPVPLLCGDGVPLLRAHLPEGDAERLRPPAGEEPAPSPAMVARLALAAPARGEARPATEARAQYHRAPEAEVKRTRGT